MTEYKFIGKSVFFPQEKILVIADLHLGYEQGLQEQGVFIPRTQYKSVIEDLERIFEEISVGNKKTRDARGGKFSGGNIINKQTKTHNQTALDLVVNNKNNNKKCSVKEIIILGDLKHEFSGNLSQEWREVLDLLAFLKEKCEKIIIIRGNHDNYLVNVIKNKGIGLKDYLIINDKAFIHGNKIYPEILDKKIKIIFLGHMHPAISIRKHAKEEKYKCFLVGKFKGKEIVILPSFFPLVEGQDLSIEDTNLAIRLNLSRFNVYVVGDKVYDFGKLSKVGRLV